VDLLEQFIKKFSKIGVTTVLDICCGTALQLRELALRGYRSIGLDASLKMLNYLQKEAQREGVIVESVLADMNNFKLRQNYFTRRV
jgi:ubiquinone/menaquinone biosynthesis C-methylase UbiE